MKADEGRSVTLRRLMPDTHGKSLDEVRRYHEQMIAQDRSAKR